MATQPKLRTNPDTIPQPAPCAIDDNGNWSSSVTLGKDDEHATSYIIEAVVVNAAVKQFFTSYAVENQNKSDWAPLSELPPGAKPYASITVVRK
jgi:hypothetical protein